MWICKTSHNFAKTGNRCVFPQPSNLYVVFLSNGYFYTTTQTIQKTKTIKPLSLINTDRRVFPILYFFTNPSIMLLIPHFLDHTLLTHFTR
jgi:hypothetical protein